MSETFFDESGEQSSVKTAIVTKYFTAWARVIMPWAKKATKPRIAYIDLFAGPGRFKDGTKSTPLLILEQAIADPQMREMLVSVFNDKNEDNTRTLEHAIAALPGVHTLRYEPQVNHEEVGTEIVKMFEKMRLVPTLFFVDPWGYKGLSLRLVASVLKDWGCDCLFFFNYNRIRMGLGNEAVSEHMNALFGDERANQLRDELEGLSSLEAELAIVEALSQALKDLGGTYVLPFTFKAEHQRRTSHHLIFVSKHVRGYEIMKEIMAAESSSKDQGVASFEYNPAILRQGILFELSAPLDDLAGMLLQRFAGQTLTMKQVYERHHVGTRFIKSNYKQVLRGLEASGRIRADPPAAGRPKRKGTMTFADKVRVTFPLRTRS